ncbi:unnamed protein product, partial [Effrenium voratum]
SLTLQLLMAMKRPAAGARKRPAAAAAPAPAPRAGSRNRLCAAEGCKFNPQRSGQRAEVLQGKDFDRCIVCGPDAFREAASTGKGGGVIARFLNKLAKADPGAFEEAVVKLKAEHPLETVQKYEKQARRKAREAAGREAEAACAPRHRLCTGQGCKFNVACLGERAEVPQNTDFRFCVICGPDAFREAAKGQGAARFLNKLAKLDLGVFEEAAAKLKAQHSEDVVGWLVERARRKAQPAAPGRKLETDWQQLLLWRQRGFRRTAAQKAAFAKAAKNGKRRLARKFPAVYGVASRPDTAWATTRAQRFRAWCLSKSWRMCGQCGRMVAQPFKAQHAAGRDRAPAETAACQHCKSEGRQGYWSPLPQDQPRRLRNLKPEVVEALRPLNIHAGPQQRMPHGYAVHGDMLRFSFKPQGVLEQVDLLPKKLKKKAKKALKHLLRSEDNAYGEFLELHYKFLHTRARGIERGEVAAGEPVKRLPASFLETPGLENCLWPHLYWLRSMCETAVRSEDVRRLRRRPGAAAGQGGDSEEDGEEGGEEAPVEGSRQSAKASFLAKIRSALVGYSEEPLLLQFVWDLWMWSGIGGCAERALASKPYSPEIWKANHMALVDLQKQIGWPALFITISPYEYSFPYHEWLTDELEKACAQRLHGPAAETLHIAHVLSQAVAGLLAGANDGIDAKAEHVFAAADPEQLAAGDNPVRHWVARLEFQDGKRARHVWRDPRFYHGSGRVHVHVLVWLSKLSGLGLENKIRADLPRKEAEPELRDLVQGSQLDWASSGWPQRERPTAVERAGEGAELLRLHHPEDAFEAHCRAYVVDILAALHCHVDVQASDGKAMLLKYCASYLPKFSDSFAAELLNDQATDFALARRILADYHPLQPEMVLQLAAQQLPQFLTKAVVKKISVPLPWRDRGGLPLPKWLANYMTCTWRAPAMTCLEFLRKAGPDGQIQQRYRRIHKHLRVEAPLEEWINVCAESGEVLVSPVFYTRLGDEYCGQWLLLNVPFLALDDLWNRRALRVPERLRFLALCLLHKPAYWRSPARVRADLELEARAETYIRNALDMLAARIELVDAYLLGELRVEDDRVPDAAAAADGFLDPAQLAPEQELARRNVVAAAAAAVAAKWPDDGADPAAWEPWLAAQGGRANRVFAVLGPAGSGKTSAVELAIAQAVQAGAHVGVACPTGMLAARYRRRFPDLDVDTIHGMFSLFKAELQTLEMMLVYDLVVIDEVGQVPLWIFERLLRLWDAAGRRPALVFVGDFAQLRGADGTCAKQSARWREVVVYPLTRMRRCQCPALRWKLELLRGATPSGTQLKDILRGHRAPSGLVAENQANPTLND